MITIKVNCPEPVGLISFRINPNDFYELTLTRPGGNLDDHITKGNNLDVTINHIYDFLKEYINLQQWNVITKEMEAYINARNETYFEIDVTDEPALTVHRPQKYSE